MSSRLRLIIPAFFAVAFFATGFSKSSTKKSFQRIGTFRSYMVNATDSNDIVVGTRTTDSTGQIAINSNDIQQTIVSTISYLDGMNLSTVSPSLMVTPVAAYIILQGTDANSSNVTVAIQMICNEDSTIIYHTHSKTLVHICKKNADCNNCQFITLGNLIYTCQCSLRNPADSTNSSCQNITYWLK